ncbi:Down syndrome critical region protein 3 homolog isoform X2 [Dendrobium catenatum]|uniref:Down syndrome critical region protein 3 homolog isoform X2 n=1 Tax=Dendrobium catenatum TaxID=906689 RepID=UPI0010A07654|nr:Down syndrome critical region protein 3 homolog isoform X2 [Dendrobium catenatum]
MTIELKLSRSNRVYCLGETVEGKIKTIFASPVSYQKIIISLTGTVNLQVKGGVTGVIESLYGVVKPICIIKKSMELATSAGKLGPGRTEINFSFSLSSEKKSGYDMFYETFHGGNISIQYLISADVTRGYLHKALSATLELIVEHDKVSSKLLFHLSSPAFSSLKTLRNINYFLNCHQVADGDVCRSMTLPIYVMLPRLLVCPTVLNGPFSIEFQVSIVISFKSELSKLYPKFDLQTPRPWLASLTLPLRVFRTT